MISQAPRLATIDDVKSLVSLEELCFKSDRISARSFRYFIARSQAEVWVIARGDNEIIAYGVVLYHRGTSLARIYSLAVHPECRGAGLAQALMQALDDSARLRAALFIRLEVAVDNLAAQSLYSRLGYKPIRRLHHYYEDGNDAVRMEKPLKIVRDIPAHLPFYAQTTEFTCGPASMLMALKKLDEDTHLHQLEELNIWREATTVFMTTGHGGTSPYGLALAAHRRGFHPRLWVSHGSAPFLDSVRHSMKKSVIELIHQDFVIRCEQAEIEVSPFPRSLDAIRQALEHGEQLILLISTYRLNRSKGPHWIWLVDIDEQYAYFNDPDVDEDLWKTPVDSIYVPVPVAEFEKMIRYGRDQYRAAILLSKPKRRKRRSSPPLKTKTKLQVKNPVE